ncbi:MAD2 mitotic arrest deficient-like 1 [Blyttiomyces sp. JEL0837]|nr:MAD2 mitotic arrest deficient-like 1 [Blyttiomyces sp. JEL0837]
MVKKYGLNLLVTCDNGLQTYLRQILSQIQKWIMARAISKLVIVISSRDTREVLERWQFNIELDTDSKKKGASEEAAPPKTEKDINAEIAAIMRQITASVSFLPMLSEPCTFNVLTYTDKNAEVPATWIDSDPRMISKNAEQVKLRSFSTSIHKVDALVAYRADSDE